MSPGERFGIDAVIERGACVGCGACAVATDGRVRVALGTRGVFQADLSGADPADVRRASRVCPFSDDAADEDVLDAPTAYGRALPHDPRLGRVGHVLAGRRTDPEALLRSSSGGLTSWLLEELLGSGEVDAVVHVARSDADGGLFAYVVSDTLQAVSERTKSYYTAPTLAGVLQRVRGTGLRYAVVGVPCFIKAVRLLQREDEQLREAVVLTVGLVCGHLKSRFFAESLAWQAGIEPRRLGGFDFRVKNADRPVNRYDYAAWATGDAEPVVREVASAVDGSWGTGAFQPGACDFCDDVFAETADVVLGDAWLPQYADRWQGTNVLVTRNAVVEQALQRGAAAGTIELEPLTADQAAASQGGNFRHRRDGLRVRLADDLAAGLKVPTKRVAPATDHVPTERLEVVRRRRALSRLSLDRFAEARATGDLQAYLVPMRRAISAARTGSRPLTSRIRRRLRAALPGASRARDGS